MDNKVRPRIAKSIEVRAMKDEKRNRPVSTRSAQVAGYAEGTEQKDDEDTAQ